MNEEKCDQNVLDFGEIVSMADLSKEAAESLCKKLTDRTGRKHDWHFTAGRVVIKAIPENLLAIFQKKAALEKENQFLKDRIAGISEYGRLNICTYPPEFFCKDDQLVQLSDVLAHFERYFKAKPDEDES